MALLFLTGFMGAGKSAVGKVLAERLRVRFTDLDASLEQAAGLTVTEIFARHGEPYFRALESRLLGELATGDGVIATGGGAVLAPENRRVMREAGRIVNLRVTETEVLARLAGDTSRPLLQGDNPAERVRELMAVRAGVYDDADLIVETTGRSVEEIVAEIIRWQEREN